MLQLLIFSTVLLNVVFIDATYKSNKALILVKSNKLELHLESEKVIALFKEASFDEESDNLTIATEDNMSSILVYNEEGELEFMFPVMSKVIVINRNMFDKGFYRLAFDFDGHTELTYAMLKLNN